ncbi:rhamnan synthesis F family protein [Rhodanobacter sp. FW102-FHT14D06]|uniref:Rhamnan synthesis F family protein n=2 Tax=unclassified Rhodanobacter TaxID=2621553 RepID=A0AB74V189_9GAMM
MSNIDSDMSSEKTTMRRVCLFSFYDEQGVVDDYVIFFLKELGKFVENIVFLSNGPLTKEAEAALHGIVSETIVRPNEGFDVLAYKEGLEKIDFNREGLYDEVLMVNHTCYGPVFPFSELFSTMEARSCDFWGITAHMEMTPNPFTGDGRLPYHLNSNFIAVRRNMLQSESFRQYWNKLEGNTTYEAAVLSHEAVFTEHFTKLGYIGDCYLDCRKYGTHYPAMLDIDETLIDRNPLLKRRAFFHDPRLLEHYAGDLPRALQVLEKTSNYDRSLIWRNVVRTAELRTLNTNAALTSVLPDVRIKQDDPAPHYGNIAVCAHVYYTDMLEELLALTDTIPCTYDFIATTETTEKKAIIEQTVTGRKNIGKVIVRVVEQNRGRDMSSLFITCRDLFLDDHYDLVCRLHTKKTPHLATGRANVFKRHMFENLLNSPGFTTNVLDMFHDKPWIGVAVPPIVHISFGTLGHAWSGNRPRVEAVAKMLDINVHFDADTPVGTFGSMFWFRPKALRKLFEHPWQWSDFEAEPYPLNGSLGHALERLICYAAQDARYTTEQILSSHLANWNFVILEYKLQKLTSLLPNSHFTYQSHILESFKRANYRSSPAVDAVVNAIRPVPPLRQAFGEFLGSVKRSIIHRSRRFIKVP